MVGVANAGWLKVFRCGLRSIVRNRLKNRATEKLLTLIECTDLARGQGPLRFAVFEFRTTAAQRCELSQTSRTPIARLGIQNSRLI